ncbi:phosphatidylinositol 4,5-bisphosphate 3-kinase catalytic subunit alpha isoform-like [Clavelina lepadiformis]|uniref:phosphatidylinositol-4,5-bisphosphate 3-kinase n=1 Tax=Clavelina lepadiformis TaxID=159417 RepID=A0ABP0G4V9_CLALP
MSPSSSHSSASGELWGFPLMPSKVTVDVMLPTGIFLSIETTRECELLDLKGKVWAMAQELPLYAMLLEQAAYVFVGVTKDAEREEFYDEQRRLCDIHLFQPVMKLVEAKGNREEKILKQSITQAIGMSVDEFDRAKSNEVDDFRRNISSLCKKVVDKRNSAKNAHSIISQFYPPKLESSAKLPLHTAENLLSRNTIVIRVWIVQKNSPQTNASVLVSYDAVPLTVISEVLKKKSLSITRQEKLTNAEMYEQYVLKICGVQEYLVGGYPICQYKYIRQCVNRDEPPNLMLESISSVLKTVSKHEEYPQPKISKYKPDNTAKVSQALPSSSVTKLFRVRVNSGSYLNVGENLYVFSNIYHGTKPLCPPQKTVELDCTEAPKWEQWLEYDISISDLPRGAKICLSVCGLRRRKDEHWPLAWANLPLFDYRGYLLQGKQTVRLWHPPCHMDGFLNPIGISGSNPRKEMPSLELEFDVFGSTVQYMCEPANYQEAGDYVDTSGFIMVGNFTMPHVNEAIKFETMSQLILSIVDRDPLSELTENEKRMLWEMKDFCIRIPESLPKLLQSVEWEHRECVQQVYAMLKKWKFPNPEVALELLDSKYPDPTVRKFATTCLERGLTDDDLLKYLLQLVTALRFETYLDSALARFLLSRAITNQRIGHYLFWHLKSEMHDNQVALRFGLILEAYCRTCGLYLDQLVRQTEIVEKLVNVNTIFQKDDNVSQKTLRDHLTKPDYHELLTDNTSPLNPAHKLGTLCKDLCEVKSSAKRPIILHWHSDDPLADHFNASHGILFKNGDDLRQDMLTLQILRVMDEIWQDDDLDLRINPYICISMGHNIGMIEIVQNAETIMNIQKKGGVVGSLQLKSGTLHQWLKDNNLGEKQYQKAVDNFTRSCAGYCVATLILGVADRHNDNIMIKKNGQMFHIDFGHFLNHKKKKYGICRNRVPFVLPGDFIRVICHGANVDPSKSPEYKDFENLCCNAYMSIRKRASVIINLLSMMLGAGLPELSSFDDIEFVRTSLAVEKNRDEALQYFRTCLAAAQNKQWTTKVDWVCHAVRHGVRK